MELSTCCDAVKWLETDLCSECLEHADFEEDEDEICSGTEIAYD